MQYIDYNSQTKISRLAFGCAAISGEGGGYGMGDISENAAIDLLLYAKNKGVNLYDTAPIYGFGMAEERLALAFNQCREDVIYVSKSGVGWHENKRVDMNNDPKLTEKMLHESLKRLQTEYIDIYMIHWPDKKWDIRYPLEVLALAQRQGKIKSIGLCNTTNEDLKLARDVCKIDFLQSECQLFNNAFEGLNTHHEMTMGWGTLDKGILTGRVHADRKYSKSDARSWAPWWNKKEVQKKVDKVAKLKKHLGYSGELSHLALQYTLSKVNIALCGARNFQQLDNLLLGLDDLIGKDLLQEAEDFLR